MNRMRTGVASTYLALCLMLGGASAAGAAANALLQLLGIALLLLHLWSRGVPAMPRDGRWVLVIGLAFAAIAAVQLIPLPFDYWRGLPGRDVAARSLGMLGLKPATMPASLDPRHTVSSLLSLIPPAAMFLVSTRLTRDERTWPVRVLLGIAVVSITIGASQLFGGATSPLRFYEFTNFDRSVGFFANANHVATLLLCSLPFAVLLLARANKKRQGSGGREGRGFIFAAIAVFIAIGIAINGSLAGYGLLLPTAAASFVLYAKTVGRKFSKGIYVAAGVVALSVVALSALGPLSKTNFAKKFDNTNTVGRNISIPTTLEAASDHLPYGSGLGSFRDLYRTYEAVEDVSDTYVNHAHNDYAEILLEMGVPGALAVLAFILWWAVRSWSVWRSEQNGAALARAGSIAIGVVLAHSLVDYPIRTSAIAALVALAAGFMVQPPAARTDRGRRRTRTGSTVRHIDAEAA